MKENKLAELSMNFSIQIIELVKNLNSKKESINSNQIGRSGTSVGANIREANYTTVKQILLQNSKSLKEANETGYWLELLFKTNYLSKEEFEKLDKLCTEIRIVLIKSLNTAKG